MVKTKNQNLKILIVMGPPGSGKGTQAELLGENFNLFHLETSEIIEKNLANIKKEDFIKIDGKKYFLFEEKRKRENGQLMSPPLITYWIKEQIKELAKKNLGIVTSGSPRTLYEAKEIIPLLKKLYKKENIRVIFIKLSEEEIIRRTSRRKICQLMRHPILANKETANLTHCPFDGSKLLIRKDDNIQIIKKRLQEYQKETLPILKFLKTAGIKINQVNGLPPPGKIFENILKILKNDSN